MFDCIPFVVTSKANFFFMISQIIELTDPEILIDQQRLEICKWMSQFYFSNLFNSSVLMLPPGSHKRYVNWLTINEDSTFSPT